MTQLADAPVAVQDDEEAGTDRRKLLMLGSLGLVVLLALAWLLFGRGGDDEALPPIVRAKPKVPAAAEGGKPAAVLLPVSSAKLGRDPFRALYTAPEPVAADPGTAPGPAPVTGGPIVGGPVAGGTVGGGSGTPVSAPSRPVTQPAAKPASTSYALQLSRVDGTGKDLTAKFLIGTSGKVQFAKPGSVFGRKAEIRLLSLQKGSKGSGTAVIQVGESVFDIRTGDKPIYIQ